jgi:hypothetical protein
MLIFLAHDRSQPKAIVLDPAWMLGGGLDPEAHFRPSTVTD